MKQAFVVENSHGDTLLRDQARAEDYVTKYGGVITKLRGPRTQAEAEAAFQMFLILTKSKGNLWSPHDAFVHVFLKE